MYPDRDFIQSEIGKVPSEWELKTLNDVTNIVRGASPRPKGDPEYFSETPTSIHWVTIADLSEFKKGKYITDTDEYLTEKGKDRSRYLPKGTLVMTNSGTIGKPAILDIDGCIHDGYLALLDIDEEVSINFLYYWLSFLRKFLDRFSQTGTQSNLNTSIAKKLTVFLPPLAEQKKIAEMLTKIDHNIISADTAISKTQNFKRGLRQRLLLKGLDHDEYKESEFGGIPNNWDIVTLEEILSSLKSGGRPRQNNSKSDDILSIGGAHISEKGEFDLSEPVRIPLEYYKNKEKGKIEERDILLVKDGATIGKTLFVTEVPEDDAVVNSHVYILRADTSKVIPYFLYILIDSAWVQNQIERYTSGSAQAGLTRKFQERTNVFLPPVEEQRQITTVLKNIDKKIKFEEKRKNKLKKIKEGLMQKLLTGKKRLKTEA